MLNSKRRIVFSSVLAMILYFVPNMVQDVHRVWGHHEYKDNFSTTAGKQLHNHYDKCAICVFEFNVVDKLAAFVYVPLLQTAVTLLVENSDHQVENKAFLYYNLRAPPQA